MSQPHSPRLPPHVALFACYYCWKVQHQQGNYLEGRLRTKLCCSDTKGLIAITPPILYICSNLNLHPS